MKNFVIVGSGRQGIAVAYDLLKSSDHYVTIVDISQDSINDAFKKLSQISDTSNLKIKVQDVTDCDAMLNILDDTDVMISAVPYEFNLKLTLIRNKDKIIIIKTLIN